MRVQEKYGIKYDVYGGKKLKNCITTFVQSCYEIYEDIKSNNRTENFYDLFLHLFCKMFCSKCAIESVNFNKLYQISCEQYLNNTNEEQYFNEYIMKKHLKHSFPQFHVINEPQSVSL